jgi:protein-L-isoaspartate(D-aspartate) O-methyltransferase
MAHIVGETGQVVTLDIDDDIVASARERLATAGWGQVQAVCTDGAYGYPDAEPYDRIILTVAAWDIAPAWEEQLKPDGRLVLPLTIRGPQLSIAFEPTGDHFQSISVAPCGFMGLRGDFAAPDRTQQLDPAPGLQFWSAESPSASPQTLYEWLTGSRRDVDTEIMVTPRDVWYGVEPWLALREAGFCTLTAQGEVAEQGIVPALFGFSGEWKSCFTSGVVNEHGLCLLMRPSNQPLPDNLMDPSPFRLFVRQFGPSERLAPELIDQLLAWDNAGRPSVENLHVRAYPPDIDYTLLPDEYLVRKRRTQLILRWP